MTEKERQWQRIRARPCRYYATTDQAGIFKALKALAEDGLMVRIEDDLWGMQRFVITPKGWRDIIAWEKRVEAYFSEAA